MDDLACPLADVEIFFNTFYLDQRGYLGPIYSTRDAKRHIELEELRISHSKENVLRGFHGDFEINKVLTILQGRAKLALIDIRPYSSTFKQVWSADLDASKTVYIPCGILNAHYCYSDVFLFYGWDAPYNGPDNQITVRWDSAGVEWPDGDKILSDRDKNAKSLEEYLKESP